MRQLAVLALLCLLPIVGACSSTGSDTARTAFAGERPSDPSLAEPGNVMSFAGPRTGLAGRTLRVSAMSEIRLARNEVILTFDDGPVPGKTEAILDILDRHRVKATFLMVGSMARAHPAIVRKVAARGHAIGSHTQNHKNLASIGFDSAVEEITQGRQSVAAALIPSSSRQAPFFRFPYLSDTPALRRHLAMQGIVVIDVDIDSKDYFQSSGDQVRSRTLAALERRGSGVILLHDLHLRTVAMLPSLLDELDRRGFKVVNLQPGGGSVGSHLVSQAAQ
jgi:peptidoglycan/xylan/chitin deacetylase (PgdA/CDA1 family)